MMPKSTRVFALLAGLLLPVTGFAQSTTPPSSAPAPATSGTTAPHPAMSPTTRSKDVDQHINALHAQLHITATQQSQWDQFAQVMRDNAAAMQQELMERGSHASTMTALENMQSYAQIAQQHAENMQKLTTAFQAVYDSMSDAQKKNADTVFRARAETHQAKKG